MLGEGNWEGRDFVMCFEDEVQTRRLQTGMSQDQTVVNDDVGILGFMVRRKHMKVQPSHFKEEN